MWSILFLKLKDENRLVEFRRDLDVPNLRGFLVDYSEEWVLMAVVGEGAIHDGWAVFRAEAICQLIWGTAALLAWEKGAAADAFGASVVPPSLTLDDTDAVIEGLAKEYRLLTFQLEALADDQQTVMGLNSTVSGELVVGDRVTLDGTVDGEFAIPIDEITCIRVDGVLERGIVRMVG